MIIKSINIKNFRSYYGNNPVVFSDGLTLIIGGNGDGKTTFFESLASPCLLHSVCIQHPSPT